MSGTNIASSLDDPRVAGVLAELYRVAEGDSAVIDRAYATIAGWPEPPTVAQQSELAATAALPVAPDVGRLLYLLVRTVRAGNIVEFGTSFGASLIYLAAAVRDSGTGHVTGTELNPDKIERALANLERAGLGEHVRILPGDARETLAALPEPVDLVLLDGWKELYLEMLQVLEPRMRPGTVVVADNLPMLPGEYLDRVRTPGNGYVSIALPLGEGIELSLRTS